MEFFHTVLLSLCFIKGCDLIVRSFCTSRAAIWNWYNASSDIGIIICATWQYSASAQEDEEIYCSVCGSVFFLLPSARSTRWFDTECRKLLLWIISISFFFFKFYKSSHSSFNSSDLICCQMHANCEALEYEQKALWAAVCVWKQKQTAFFRNAIIPPPSVFAVTGMFRFYRLSVIMMTLLVFLLPLHWLCASICVSCSGFFSHLLQPQPMNWLILPA